MGSALHAHQRDVHLRDCSPPYGWWNEQRPTDRVRHGPQTIVKANVLAMREILEVRPDALSSKRASEYYHAEDAAAIGPAETMQSEALPLARPELRPAASFRHVRVPVWTTG